MGLFDKIKIPVFLKEDSQISYVIRNMLLILEI